MTEDGIFSNGSWRSPFGLSWHLDPPPKSEEDDEGRIPDEDEVEDAPGVTAEGIIAPVAAPFREMGVETCEPLFDGECWPTAEEDEALWREDVEGVEEFALQYWTTSSSTLELPEQRAWSRHVRPSWSRGETGAWYWKKKSKRYFNVNQESLEKSKMTDFFNVMIDNFPNYFRISFILYDTEVTVRWSNFDPRDPKMGLFLQSTEATSCGHHLKWKLTPENPLADTMFMAAMAMVLPWKIVENFKSF